MKHYRRFHISPEGHLIISVHSHGRWTWLLPLIPWCVLGGGIGLIIGVTYLAIVNSG